MNQDERLKFIQRDCPEGWVQIAINLNEELNDLIPDYNIFQIKEKFGGLRYYIDFPPNTNSEIRAKAYLRIDEAEWEAELTCQDCGNPGKIREGSWLRTLCDSCLKQNYKASVV